MTAIQAEASPMDKGAFVISIDTEMAWGVVDRNDTSKYYSYINERGLISQLLALFEEYDIRATWCVVGHLFLDRCENSDGQKHPDIVRPPYSWHKGDWFDNDPCTSLSEDKTWYGKDIVESIASCEVPQEIGSHSFSHFIAGDPEFTEEAFRSDLAKCREVAQPMGLQLRSFVYPRNSIGHEKALAEQEFVAFRGRAPRTNSSRMSGVSPTYPEKRDRLWNFPATYFYNPSTYRWKFLPYRMDVSRVKKQLNLAAERKSLVHVWFHPHNLTAEPIRALSGLEEIFKHASTLRSKGRIESITMGDLADRLNTRRINVHKIGE